MTGNDKPPLKQLSYNQPGSSRSRRQLPALHPDFFKIDDRTLADFLVFADRYAALLYADGFPELEDKRPVKTWKDFFSSDISVFLAKLISGKAEKKITYTYQTGVTPPPVVITEKLDLFFGFLSTISGILPFKGGMATIDQKTLYLLHHLDEIKLQADQVLHLCTRMGIVCEYETKHSDAESLENQLNADPANMAQLDAILDSFLTQSHKVIYSAQDLFHHSLHHNQHHDPAMALFIAFLKLYDYVREDLNLITGKHLDYFFKKLLRQQNKPPEPDQVIVCVRLSDHIEHCMLEQGTLFKAGIDEDGFDCLYEAEDYLTVNKAQVTAMGSIYISRKADIGVEPDYEFVSAIYESPMLESKGGGFNFPKGASPFPTFGEEQYDIKVKTMTPSEVGFAIASPVLILRAGVRKVKLGIQFNLKSMSPLVSFFERYSQLEKMSAEDVFHKIFSDAFHISLTTAKGWYNVTDYAVLPPDWSSGKVEFVFVLPMGAPGIEPMGEEWDANEVARFSTPWPVMKFGLSDQKTMNTYSYLQHLIVNEYTIDVEVKGIKNLEVYNDLGKIETSIPFYPFGPLPILGSSFVVGYDELSKKHIKDISFELTWHNLPRNNGGFKEYYEDYTEKIDNQSFKIGITALSNHEFHPATSDKRQVFPLFANEAESDQSSLSRPAAKTVIKGIDVNLLKINNEIDKNPLQPFDNTTKSGYIKLELVEPEMGFGHSEYPVIAARKILSRSKDGMPTVPNPPYIPQVKFFVLNYQGTTKINFQKLSATHANPQAEEKVFQLQPFGVRTIFENAAPVIDSLLPQFSHNGYLFLGLEDITPGESVTFYFVLDPNKVIDSDAALPEIEWFFVNANSWVPFDKRFVLSDTTKSFTTSGILKLRMPLQISRSNTVLANDKYWIIAGLKGSATWTAKIRSVFTQALTLCWKSHKPGAEWRENIPAGRIESLVYSRSEVAAVFQPMPSFGGRSKEDLPDFYTRVSERLRHKNRGVTAWDIERLVLEKFSAINQVKCLSPLEHGNYIAAGNIVLVVVPKVVKSWETAWPKCSPGELVAIQTYVEKVVSPFVQVKVINPIYEEVKITARIVLMDKESRGRCEEELHRDIRSFICPWYTDPTEEMQLGGQIDIVELTGFLNARPYLMSISGVSVLVLHYNEGTFTISDLNAITDVKKTVYASRPWSVLVPMRNHQISVQEEDSYLTPEKAAIENMRLGSEFVIAAQTKEEQEVLPTDWPTMNENVVFDIEL